MEHFALLYDRICTLLYYCVHKTNKRFSCNKDCYRIALCPWYTTPEWNLLQILQLPTVNADMKETLNSLTLDHMTISGICISKPDLMPSTLRKGLSMGEAHFKIHVASRMHDVLSLCGLKESYSGVFMHSGGSESVSLIRHVFSKLTESRKNFWLGLIKYLLKKLR